jgi:hypothetical protein
LSERVFGAYDAESAAARSDAPSPSIPPDLSATRAALGALGADNSWPVDVARYLSYGLGTLAIMATELVPLDRVLRRQDGLLTRGQLRRSGVTESRVRAQIAGCRWRAVNDAVVCTHNGPLTESQARWAAVLSAQPPVALCGLTALQQWGVSGFATAVIHVVVGRGCRVLAVPNVRVAVHESRRFGIGDISTEHGPATTNLERSVIDAAAWSPNPWTASRIVVAPIQQRLTSAAALRGALKSAGHIRHSQVLRALLADLHGGAEALSEVEFLRWCRRHGFPKPDLQVRLDGIGRRRYIDAGFRRTDGSKVLVEVDGGIHLTLATRWQDSAKDNDAVIAGETTLRFPSVAIYSNDPVAVRQLRAALAVVSAPRASGDVWR